MTFPKIFISLAERNGEFKYYTFSAIYGIKLIQTFSDDVLFKLMEEKEPEFTAVSRQIGPKTNPSWITTRAAETLYERGVIDERKLDDICR